MAILKIRDANGKVQEIYAIRGEKGDTGADGKDYVLTEADKAEIAGMVPGAEKVDLSNYYTKDEVNNLIPDIEDVDLSNYYTKDQIHDLIPQPSEGDESTYLSSDGTWTRVSTNEIYDTERDDDLNITLNDFEGLINSHDEIIKSIKTSMLTSDQVQAMIDESISKVPVYAGDVDYE